jgi:DNA-binding NarL/FixJ family response regulator
MSAVDPAGTAPNDQVPQLIRVVLVDDDSLMRAGLRMIIEQSDDIVVAGEAGDGADGLRLVRQERPDVVLMDVRMPGMNGIEATQVLTDSGTEVRVIVLTTFEMEEYVFGALRAGASGFLLKRTKPEQLLAGIRAVAEGDALLSPSVTRRVIEEFTSAGTVAQAPDPRLSQLTEREREVLVQMAGGLSNDEIAETLFIAENTVKTHVKHVMSKLGSRDRVQAVVAAYEGGLMRPQ